MMVEISLQVELKNTVNVPVMADDMGLVTTKLLSLCQMV
jgi:hypothetical protein